MAVPGDRLIDGLLELRQPCNGGRQTPPRQIASQQVDQDVLDGGEHITDETALSGIGADPAEIVLDQLERDLLANVVVLRRGGVARKPAHHATADIVGEEALEPRRGVTRRADEGASQPVRENVARDQGQPGGKA